MDDGGQVMIGRGISYRLATEADLPGIARVRTSVREILLSLAQLAECGITNASVAASFRGSAQGWVALHEAEIVGFAIADRENHGLFALAEAAQSIIVACLGLAQVNTLGLSRLSLRSAAARHHGPTGPTAGD